MAWIIVKSVGDDFSFTPVHIPGGIGHPHKIAKEMAEEVTKAMKEYKMNHYVRNPNCTCSNYVLENFGCICGVK